MPVTTKAFQNGRSTAVRIPAEFGFKPGEALILSQDADGTVRIARARPFASFFAALERMRAEGRDPAAEPFHLPPGEPPREVDLTRDDGLAVGPRIRKRRKPK